MLIPGSSADSVDPPAGGRGVAPEGRLAPATDDLLALAADAADLGVWYVDLDSGEFVASDKALELNGVARGTRLDHLLAATVIHPDDRPRVEATVSAAIAERSFFEAEFRCRWRDGSEHWLLARGRIVRHPGVHRLVGIVQDVTQLKRREEQLVEARREAEDRAREAFEAKAALEALMACVPAGITVVTGQPDVTTAMVSRYGAELLAQGWSETRGMSMEDWLARVEHYLADGRTPARTEDLPAWRAAKLGETVRNVELVLRTPGGAVVDVLCDAAPIRDRDGTVHGGVVAWRDVTEQKKATEALRESERRYRSMFEAITEGFAIHEIVCDAAGHPVDYRFLEVNPAFEQLTGLSRADVVGRLKSEVIPVDETDWVGIYGKVALTGVPVQFESHSSALGRDYAVFAFRPAPMQFAVLFIDVTERRRLERDLRESEGRIREFLGVLSHELRNPLAPIMNGVEILARAGGQAPSATRAVEVIRRQTTHLARLVDDLLDLTRIQRGKFDLHRTRVDLRDVVRRTVDDHRTIFEARRVALATSVPDGAVLLDADPIRVAQCLGNLLDNAAKFTAAGGNTWVTVETAGARARLSVRDDGPGIAPELLPLVFEPFTQAERSLARTRGGLGLGLALVKSLVEMHGGEVAARSSGAGRGAELVIELPLATA